MKEIKRKEQQLLANICYQNKIPLKLASELIKAAEKFSYENVSQGTKLKEYQELIDLYTKNK